MLEQLQESVRNNSAWISWQSEQQSSWKRMLKNLPGYSTPGQCNALGDKYLLALALIFRNLTDPTQ